MNNINKYKSDIILDLNIDDDRFGFATLMKLWHKQKQNWLY